MQFPFFTKSFPIEYITAFNLYIDRHWPTTFNSVEESDQAELLFERLRNFIGLLHQLQDNHNIRIYISIFKKLLDFSKMDFVNMEECAEVLQHLHKQLWHKFFCNKYALATLLHELSLDASYCGDVEKCLRAIIPRGKQYLDYDSLYNCYCLLSTQIDILSQQYEYRKQDKLWAQLNAAKLTSLINLRKWLITCYAYNEINDYKQLAEEIVSCNKHNTSHELATILSELHKQILPMLNLSEASNEQLNNNTIYRYK